MIFENATLCSQFLSEYTGVELFKDLKPEDIEDMTERFLSMFTEERASDVVKKINLRDKGEMYVIALIEHKSSVDYSVVMQNKGVTKTKDFRYPPILPIIYYEDTAKWTSARNLRERIDKQRG